MAGHGRSKNAVAVACFCPSFDPAGLGPAIHVLECGATGDADARQHRWRSAESLLLPIGEALAKFICEEDFSDVKACEGASCTLMFADHTRRRARRWCSMAICGNRAKQAAHRERLKHKN